MKKLEELQIDEIIYIYSIATFPDKEVLIKFPAKVYKVNKEYSTASVYEKFDSAFPIRRIVKMNEGNVFRNSIWLSNEDDESAEKILLDHYARKIEIAENEIKLYKERIEMIIKFFDKVQ